MSAVPLVHWLYQTTLPKRTARHDSIQSFFFIVLIIATFFLFVALVNWCRPKAQNQIRHLKTCANRIGTAKVAFAKLKSRIVCHIS